MPNIYVNYGYDVHSINVSAAALSAIKAGKHVVIDGQGFAHDEEGVFVDHWSFNGTDSPAHFWLENGAEFHAQEMWFDE